MEGKMLSAEELAERLGLTVRKVLELANEGLIPEVRVSERIRRFDYDDVIAALKAVRRGPKLPGGGNGF